MMDISNNDSGNQIAISAVIPAYNCEKYIARAINSVLEQSCAVDEIVIVDDGSSDETAAIIKSFGDKVRYIYQQNAGVSVARNVGIQAAKGGWIAFLDGDDEWLPNKIKLQTELLNRNPELIWVSGNYTRCLCEEKRMRPQVTDIAIKNALNEQEYFRSFFDAYIQGIWGCTDTMLIRKSVLQEAGLFRIGQHQMEDIDLWWKIAMRHPFLGYVPEPMAIYHLGVPGSLIQSQTDYSECREMIRRHLADAQNTPHAEIVKACSITMLKRWMRSMLFSKQSDEIRKMLTEFDDLFSGGYKRTMRLFVSQPTITAACLRMISRVVRALRIRQQLTRKPK